MKRKLASVLFGLLFLIGFGIFIYPTVSDQWNTYKQSQLITGYEDVIEQMEEKDFTEEWERARKFNEEIIANNIYADIFGVGSEELQQTEYWKVLNVGENGLMGYISLPKIKQKLAIYHGTGEDVLQTGVGHLNGSKLPIGGESSHTILAAHRGLPSARLFTDVDQLVPGDMIYLHILDKVLAYQVDQILDMVDKDDSETLEEAMRIEEGKDQITLFTCTPYGVNSHRLLVRGTRVPYEPDTEEVSSVTETMLEDVQNYYMIYLIMGVSVILLIIVIIKFVIGRKRKNARNKQLDLE